MDPLVRSAAAIQRLLSRSAGTLISVAFALFLVRAAATDADWRVNTAVALLFTGSLVLRALRRLGRLAPKDVARLDLELFTHLTIAGYAVVWLTPGRLDGTYYPVLCGLMMLTAGFARAGATAGTVLFAVTLESALSHFALDRPPSAVLPHAALLGAFALLNLLVFRSEITRVRRLSRSHLEGELERMKEDARSYRLIGAPTSAVEPVSSPHATAPKGDPERLVRSSVDEIHATLRFALDLLRKALGLQGVALLWLSGDGQRLVLREMSPAAAADAREPFPAAAGLLGAALRSRTPVSLTGPRAKKHAPHRVHPEQVESICAVPILEHGHVRGLIVADRSEATPFVEAESQLLLGVGQFILRAIENERIFVQLERAKVEQGKLYRAVESLAAAGTEGQVIEHGVNSAREFAAFDYAIVTLFHNKKTSGTHEICAASGKGIEHLVGQSFRHNGGLVSMVVANRHPLPYRGDYDPARQLVFSRYLQLPDVPSLVVLPLLARDSVLGTLVLGSNKKGAFGDAVRPTLEVLASHIAVSLANARMVKRLEELATTDGMTGHFNKRTLTELARQKLRSAERFKKPLSLLVCDIDHFKKVNDSYGHDVGDVVIKGFGEVLRRTKRETDEVGRFGGEEFVVVCEETDSEGAEQLGERIRAELAGTTFHTPQGSLQVECSIGVATYPRAGADWESMFKATDEALYASKRGGRNRVTVWSPKLRSEAAA